MIDPRQLHGRLEHAGGFTLDPRSGDEVHHGVSVALRPSLALRLPAGGWDDVVVAGWLRSRARPLRYPRHGLGGWRQEGSGEVWLDVVTLFPASMRPLVRVLATLAGEHGGFDLERGELVRAW